MKILLFGEYSGLFNCLKDGLIQNGQDVYLVSSGDGPKNYPSDFRWDVNFPIGGVAKILGFLNLIIHFQRLSGYDAVMFVSPSMSKYSWINKIIYGGLVRNNKKSFLVSSGLYATSFTYWFNKEGSKYYQYTHMSLEEPNIAEGARHNKPKLVKYEQWLFKRITGIIPIWYEYAEPYRDNPKLLPAVRIPINLDKYTYHPNIVNDKIVFLHGKTRACKGGKYIIAAFDKLRDKYKNQAEFIALDKILPFDEYMALMNKVNVILDDANSYSFAMNILFAMAQGKICMGGAEPESNKELGYAYNPVFNLTSDVDQICGQIEYIINNKDRIEEWGAISRKFVEKYHDYREVAKQYIALIDNSL